MDTVELHRSQALMFVFKFALLLAILWVLVPTVNAQLFQNGTKINLIADNGMRMSRCNGCQDVVNGSLPDTLILSEGNETIFTTFTVINDAGSGKVMLKADTGNMVSYCNGCIARALSPDSLGISTSPDTNSIWNKFELVKLSNGKYTLKAPNGKYVARCDGCSPSFQKRTGFNHGNIVMAHETNGNMAYAQWTIVLSTGALTSFSPDETTLAFHDVINGVNALGATPTSGKLWDTYSTKHLFETYSAGIDHVGGIAWLADGRLAVSESGRAGKSVSLLVVQSETDSTKFITIGDGRHPGGMQAVGNVIAVPITGGNMTGSEVVFVDARDKQNPKQLPIKITTTGEVNSAGIVYSLKDNLHYVVTATVPDYGKRGNVTLWKSNGKSLFDADCSFTSLGSVTGAFASQGGTQLIYDVADDNIYIVALYRVEPDGETGEQYSPARESGTERIAVSKLNITYTREGNAVTSADLKVDRELSDSGAWSDYGPGFRWGGTLRVSSYKIQAVGVARTLAYGLPPSFNYTALSIWK